MHKNWYLVSETLWCMVSGIWTYLRYEWMCKRRSYLRYERMCKRRSHLLVSGIWYLNPDTIETVWYLVSGIWKITSYLCPTRTGTFCCYLVSEVSQIRESVFSMQNWPMKLTELSKVYYRKLPMGLPDKHSCTMRANFMHEFYWANESDFSLRLFWCKFLLAHRPPVHRRQVHRPFGASAAAELLAWDLGPGSSCRRHARATATKWLRGGCVLGCSAATSYE